MCIYKLDSQVGFESASGVTQVLYLNVSLTDFRRNKEFEYFIAQMSLSCKTDAVTVTG